MRTLVSIVRFFFLFYLFYAHLSLSNSILSNLSDSVSSLLSFQRLIHIHTQTPNTLLDYSRPVCLLFFCFYSYFMKLRLTSTSTQFVRRFKRCQSRTNAFHLSHFILSLFRSSLYSLSAAVFSMLLLLLVSRCFFFVCTLFSFLVVFISYDNSFFM